MNLFNMRSGQQVVHASPTAQSTRLAPRQKRLRAQKQLYERQQQQQKHQQQLSKHTGGREQQQQPRPIETLTLYPPSAAVAPQSADFLWSVWEQPRSAKGPSDLDTKQIAHLVAHWAQEAHVQKAGQHPQHKGFAALSEKQRNYALSNLTSLLAYASSTQLCPLAPGSIKHEAAWAAAHFQELSKELHSKLHALERTMCLPFRVLPLLMPHLELRELMNEVKLSRHKIFLDGGAKAVRDALRAATGEHYDSVLINYYEDERVGMRFHADPLYDCWTPATAVVSVGAPRSARSSLFVTGMW
ncbi:hypothetical protein DUNSADRAFT_12085 [Dunaliella salina]|uniref:Uncharacterized protein n=1 Tax=Dunaliella salina TaxID=3046 RepID=A0ABQ7H441_DUNSA|nr:hypothetical protein DUNSADRAFT_12085 [Dunaliella salina]|eukprot:KAF5841629.1 hypothetical protein DUNSADRAFT_12085 [Dunaliella salina]